MSNQPPRTRPPSRRVTTETSVRNSGRSNPPPPRRPSTNVNAPRRDPFPYVLGGILALLVIGIFVVVFLISSGQNQPPVAGSSATATPPVAQNPQPGVTTVVDTSNGGAATPTASGSTPPRMPIADFKALYDDPAKRANMLIIDVRAKESYEAGHIRGSESWPESSIDATNVKLPKDKLIVAYCQ